MLLFGLAPIFGVAIAFVLLIIPMRRIVSRAGFADTWAWLSATLLLSTEIIRIGLAAWSVLDPTVRSLFSTFNSWLSYLFALEAFGLLWLFAFARWPAILTAHEGKPRQ